MCMKHLEEEGKKYLRRCEKAINKVAKRGSPFIYDGAVRFLIHASLSMLLLFIDCGVNPVLELQPRSITSSFITPLMAGGLRNNKSPGVMIPDLRYLCFETYHIITFLSESNGAFGISGGFRNIVFSSRECSFFSLRGYCRRRI